MGSVFTNYARYNEALEQYQLGIEANPNFAELYNALAYAYFATSRIPEAIVTFENTIRIDPNNATAYDGLAYMYIQLGVDADAIDNALRAVELNPNMARAYGRLGHAYFRQSNYPEAIEALETATAMYREPTSLNALFFQPIRAIPTSALAPKIAPPRPCPSLKPFCKLPYPALLSSRLPRKGWMNVAVPSFKINPA
jgi:tetratricopeptide (TPR) repeat protein